MNCRRLRSVLIMTTDMCVRSWAGEVRNFGLYLKPCLSEFRQPGSARKPLTVYTAKFEQNYTPDSIVTDEPIEDGPRNANGTYLGEITVRTAVEKPSIRSHGSYMTNSRRIKDCLILRR